MQDPNCHQAEVARHPEQHEPFPNLTLGNRPNPFASATESVLQQPSSTLSQGCIHPPSDRPLPRICLGLPAHKYAHWPADLPKPIRNTLHETTANLAEDKGPAPTALLGQDLADVPVAP